MLSKPLAAVHATTSMSGVSGNGAVSRPSLIGMPPRSGRRPPSDPRGRCAGRHRRRASRRGRRRTWRSADRHSGRRPGHRHRRPGSGRRGCRRSPRRGRPAGPTAALPRSDMRAGFLSRISLARSRWPNHIWSGFSESQASDDSEPSISYCSEFLRPALIWLIATDAAGAALEAEQDERRVLGRDLALDRVGRPFRAERLDRAGRLHPGVDERGQVGHDRGDALAGHEGHQVHPVRPDVADRPQRAAAARLEAPVPVTGEEQPVLEVAPRDEPDIAQRPGRDRVAGMLIERVAADVEVGRVDQAGPRRQGDQLGRLGRGHGQRLLAHDVPPGLQDRPGLGQVQVVGRGDVDDLDALVGQQLVQVGVGPGDAQRVGPRRATFRGAAQHAVDLARRSGAGLRRGRCR